MSEDLERSFIRFKNRSTQDNRCIDPYYGKVGLKIHKKDHQPAANRRPAPISITRSESTWPTRVDLFPYLERMFWNQ